MGFMEDKKKKMKDMSDGAQDNMQDMGDNMEDKMGMEEQGDTKMRRSNTESDKGM
jgi:hypothetical protein